MSDGGEGGGGEGGGEAAAPEPSDGGDDSTNPLVNMWKEYERLLDEKPLLMKMATSATGFFIGDVLAQTCIQKNPEFDYFRLFRLASFGFLVHGSTSCVLRDARRQDPRHVGGRRGVEGVHRPGAVEPDLRDHVLLVRRRPRAQGPRLRRRQGPERIDDGRDAARAIPRRNSSAQIVGGLVGAKAIPLGCARAEALCARRRARRRVVERWRTRSTSASFRRSSACCTSTSIQIGYNCFRALISNRAEEA